MRSLSLSISASGSRLSTMASASRLGTMPSTSVSGICPSCAKPTNRVPANTSANAVLMILFTFSSQVGARRLRPSTAFEVTGFDRRSVPRVGTRVARREARSAATDGSVKRSSWHRSVPLSVRCSGGCSWRGGAPRSALNDRLWLCFGSVDERHGEGPRSALNDGLCQCFGSVDERHGEAPRFGRPQDQRYLSTSSDHDLGAVVDERVGQGDELLSKFSSTVAGQFARLHPVDGGHEPVEAFSVQRECLEASGTQRSLVETGLKRAAGGQDPDSTYAAGPLDRDPDRLVDDADEGQVDGREYLG